MRFAIVPTDVISFRCLLVWGFGVRFGSLKNDARETAVAKILIAISRISVSDRRESMASAWSRR